MGTVTNIKHLKYQKHFDEFYAEMDLDTIKDLIMYSYQQGDFNSLHDQFERARLRALLNRARKNTVDREYLFILDRFYQRVK